MKQIITGKYLPNDSFQLTNNLHLNSSFSVPQVEALLKGSLFACINSIPETVLIENHIVHSSPIPDFITRFEIRQLKGYVIIAPHC